MSATVRVSDQLDSAVVRLIRSHYLQPVIYIITLILGILDRHTRLFEDTFTFCGCVLVPGKNSSVEIRRAHRVPKTLSYGEARQQATAIARRIADGTESITVMEAIVLYAGGAISRRQLLSAETSDERALHLRAFGCHLSVAVKGSP
jgi:hypothetical protein